MSSKRIAGIIALLLIIAPTSDAWGFDGSRKGFVIGGGLGFAPIARWSAPDVLLLNEVGDTLGTEVFNDTRVGVGVNILLGYAWNERNMIVYEGNASGYKSRKLAGDLVITQGFYGAAWYHYYGPMGATFFSVIGVGLYQFDIENSPDFDAGIGGLLGGGYEFSPHYQVGLYISTGRTSILSTDFSHLNISALVSAVAF
ncbi:MAG: hypothetical protein IIB00_10670 [candidate division Zixibacteria bacterium]|nr:hypothetical protein [candidate division Zixibacteria bacterium]